MKTSTFGLLATATLILTPVAALAQDNQQNLQLNRNAAATVGGGNFVNQNTNQISNQSQLSIDSYGYGESSSQISVQDSINEGAAAGHYNLVNQGTTQTNGQSNNSIDTYPVYYPNY